MVTHNDPSSIRAKAVTLAKMADGTDGELITWDANGVIAAVAVGNSGEVLTSGGAGVAPAFAAAASGDITAVTAGVGLSGGGTTGAVTLTLDLSELSTVTPADGDFFSTLDSDGANEQKTTTTALATLLAGTGLTASSSVIGVDAAQTQITSVGTIGTGVWQGTAIASGYIAADAITAAKIADDVINSEHYAAASIDNEHLADNAVDTAEIADNAITLAKMAGIARGKIIYGDASNDPAVLAVGTADQVLTSDGTDISWEDAAGGASGDLTDVDSILKTDLYIGEDAQTRIDFETANEIHFDADNTQIVNIKGTSVDITTTVYINETANTDMTTGITINQGAADNGSFSLKSSDVGHATAGGLFSAGETDTYFHIGKASGANGGAGVFGANDDGAYAMIFHASARDVDTAKTTSGQAPVALRANLHNGSGAGLSITSDGNIAVIQDAYTGNTRFIFDIEGSGHADVEFTTYDDHDDLALIDGLQNVMTGRMTPARYGDNAMYYDREYLESTGIIGKDSWHTEVRDDGRVQQRQMVNFTKLSMLHHGALLQVGDRLLALEQKNTALRGQLATAGVLPEA